ncbi:MAG: DUF3150 domain-containing protein [Proteobacteria bacterium]|nr:DUF3150 domain-containing protein [Pseudomonadota bacterium]
MNTIFERACLLQLHVRMWQGQKMVEPSVMARIGNTQWLTGRKRLVDPESLGSVATVARQARTILKKHALPFPIDGLTLVPKDTIHVIEGELLCLQQEFRRKAEEFTNQYQACRQDAMEALGELFSETDYPMRIEERFSFEWRYVHLALPGKSRVLSAEIYEREKRKFMDLMETTRAEAMAALRTEFAGLVEHMASRLGPSAGERPKVLRASMIEKLEEFLRGFENRNLFEDEDLEGLVAQARNIMRGVDIESLRDSEHLRSRIRDDMEKLKEAVDASVETMPRRRILMVA